MFEINVVYSKVNIEECPDRCECSLVKCSYGNGSSSVCVWRSLKKVPTGLPNDTCTLDISFNQIKSIDYYTFEDTVQLEELDLSVNTLSELRTKVFYRLLSLKALFMRYNQIDTVENKAFEGLTNLEILDLSENRFSEISGKMLSDVPNLIELLLDGNQIANVDTHAFQGLLNLQKLSLKRNNIVILTKDTFVTLPTLHFL